MKRTKKSVAALLAVLMLLALLPLNAAAANAVTGIGEATLDPELTVYNRSLNIQSYIGVDYTVYYGKASVLRNNYDSFFMTARIGDGAEQYLDVLSVGTVYVAFELKTTATQMTQPLTVTLYAVKDGAIFRGPSDACCIRDGVMGLLKNEANPERMTLAIDLLQYGAAAQTAFGQRTDDLANSQLGSYAQYGTQTAPVASGSITSDGKGAAFRMKSLALQSTIETQYLFEKGDHAIDELEARIVYDGVSHAVPVTAYGSKYATFSYDGLAACDVRKTFTVAVYNKKTGEAITETLTASLEAFAAEKVAEYAGNAQMLALIDAMLRYCGSAEAMFG